MNPRTTRVRAKATCRLVRSRHPSVDVFAAVSPPADRAALADLESWTNDRIQNDLDERVILPRAERATGPNASVVNAAFCHPHPTGARFTTGALGAWYAAFELETAHAEVAFHWGQELAEIGRRSGRVQARLYLADFDATLHDVRDRRTWPAAYGRKSYARSQALGVRLRAAGSNGIVYDSVRRPGHDCLVAFRARLVRNVRQSAHFEYEWGGRASPAIRRLGR